LGASGWEIARDPDEVHALLLDSDRASATLRSPPPRRNEATTARRFGEGAVHLLRRDGRAVAMVTLTQEPPFDLARAGFSPAARPLYMQRLAVAGAAAGAAWPGLAALRRAIEVADAAGADALRCEANPGLAATFSLLTRHGFVPHAAETGDDGRARVYLERRPRV